MYIVYVLCTFAKACTLGKKEEEALGFKTRSTI